jgi:hypothetical protein
MHTVLLHPTSKERWFDTGAGFPYRLGVDGIGVTDAPDAGYVKGA